MGIAQENLKKHLAPIRLEGTQKYIRTSESDIVSRRRVDRDTFSLYFREIGLFELLSRED